MIVDHERRELPARYGNPFRSKGIRSTLCPRCPEYRRNGVGAPLARWGLLGVCIRPEGLCGEVRR